MGPSTPVRRENAGFSVGRREELPLQQVLWYFSVQPKRPFIIPIPLPFYFASMHSGFVGYLRYAIGWIIGGMTWPVLEPITYQIHV